MHLRPTVSGAHGVAHCGSQPFRLHCAGVTVMTSGVVLVAVLGAVALLAAWLVVAMFRVSRSQPAALDGRAAGPGGQAAGREPDEAD